MYTQYCVFRCIFTPADSSRLTLQRSIRSTVEPEPADGTVWAGDGESFAGCPGRSRDRRGNLGRGFPRSMEPSSRHGLEPVTSLGRYQPSLRRLPDVRDPHDIR